MQVRQPPTDRGPAHLYIVLVVRHGDSVHVDSY